MRATPKRPPALRPLLAVSAGVWMAAAIAPVGAKPLDAESCLKLTTEIKTLDEQGIREIAEKGPSAAKSAASREQMDKVRVYLTTLGQLRFRCPQDAPLVALRPEPAEDPAEAGAATAPIDANATGITLPPGVAAAIVAPIVPKKPAAPKAPAIKAVTKPAAMPPAAPQPATAKPATPQPATGGATVAQPVPPVRKAPAKAAAPVPAVVADPAIAPAVAKPKPKPRSDDAFRPATPEAKPPAVPQ